MDSRVLLSPLLTSLFNKIRSAWRPRVELALLASEYFYSYLFLKLIKKTKLGLKDKSGSTGNMNEKDSTGERKQGP